MKLADAFARQPVLAVLRGRRPEGVVTAAETLAAAGVLVIEVTFTVPDAPGVVAALRKTLPGHVVGAGTVTTREEVDSAVDAGAEFLVSPGTPGDLLNAMLKTGIPSIPGAYTPSEVMATVQAGAPFVKLFPACTLGPRYLGQLRGPLQDVRAIPTGGLEIRDVPAWLGQGAAAVGLSTALCSPSDIEAEAWDLMTSRARELLAVTCEVT
jgi:2-dehydro-3-deoxyphosphogluconate aldolase / (4S)-4-hydroxy-2-oxoglutarate aldolase